jgi:heme A synthase
MFYTILLKSHSGLRWVLLASLILAMVKYYRAARGNRHVQRLVPYTLISMILMHIQVLLGLTMYYLSPKVIFAAESMKNSVHRFFLVEHIGLMIIAAIIITIGYSKTKNQVNTPYGAKKLLIYYFVAFILILSAIPWPFRGLGTAWI